MLSRRKLGLGLGAAGLLAGTLAAIPLASADARTGSAELTAATTLAAAPILDPRCPRPHADVINSNLPQLGIFDRWEQLNTVIFVDGQTHQCQYQGVHALKDGFDSPIVRIPGTIFLPMPR
jgi:hypothetical protein